MKPRYSSERRCSSMRRTSSNGLITVVLMMLAVVANAVADADPPSPTAAQPAIPKLPPEEIIRRVLDPTEIIAVVGDQAILSGELLPTANQMLEKFQGQIPEAQLNQQRVLAVRQLLQRKIESKLVYLDFLRTIPEDKAKEAMEGIHKQIDEQFYQDQVEKLMEQLEVASLPALEEKLRAAGSSLNRQKQEFREQAIAQSMVGRKIESSPEITHDQLLAEYQKEPEKYDIKSRACWEALTVLFEKFPDRLAAERAIVDMGNEVLRGAPFAEVAKRSSQGTNASSGGSHTWTTRGALISSVIDDAIFSLPIGQLSRILEDDSGFHIVRVTERENAHRIPFAEAQDEIREKLENEQRKEVITGYVQELRETTYVWTVFD
jgi:hypothetical protein